MNAPIFSQLAALTLILFLTACGGGSGSNSSNTLLPNTGTRVNTSTSDEDTLSDVYAWKPQALYASALYDCALPATEADLCSLVKLPLLGMQTATPTIDDIMSRVLVSHDWMANRLEQLLEDYPTEMLPLFGAVTAIVIDDDIRPAYYSSSTGAIYIDPFYLWVTNDEKATINTKQDYRASFSDPLAFRNFARYLDKDGNLAFDYGSLYDTAAREYDHTLLISARLLLHELAHANDFVPPDSYQSLNQNNTVLEAVNSLSGNRISDQLTSYAPLTSDVLYALGQVLYQGETATSAQTQITAAEVGAEFESDAAADPYAYSTQFEDLAMLFEITMMKQFFDLDYEVGFVEPTGSETTCADYLIGWSSVGWIGDTDVKDRAMFVSNELMPDLELSMFYQELEAPTANNLENWCLPEPAIDGLAKPSAFKPINPADYQWRPH